MTRSPIVSSLASLLCLVACALAPRTHAETAAKGPVGKALAAFVEEGTLAGAVAVVATGEAILAEETVGFRDLESRDAMRSDSLFWIASMTKPITAMAVMMLVEEGKLGLDDPVAKHLPAFRGQMRIEEKSEDRLVLTKPSRPATLRDLMTHTAGVAGSPALEGGALDVLSLREAVLGYGLLPLLFEPGEKWAYSNPGINVLGRLVEVASGEDYAAFLQRRLFDPLGMADTTFWPDEGQMARLATAYQPKKEGSGLEPTTIRYLTEPYSNERRAPLAAGGLFSTAGDLLKLYRMLLGGGEADGRRFLSRESIAEMASDQVPGLKAGFTEGMGMGLGFQVVREARGVTETLSPGTYGHGGAYGTQGWIDPEKGLIHILLIQRAGLSNGDASPMREAFHRAGAGLR
jgi:CubicO group peptidase (beta-lactamase class C family)